VSSAGGSGAAIGIESTAVGCVGNSPATAGGGFSDAASWAAQNGTTISTAQSSKVGDSHFAIWSSNRNAVMPAPNSAAAEHQGNGRKTEVLTTGQL
jgi:hypothetical protein